ncbi:hypothetical protein RvY_16264 [Ramazzottius varieornatus]|uniref:Uncharacterized protein n=1 Tax=Ramazzottius varieornatus TaxID=947166 RepID=A0A1D1W0R6_RAMVA|nr:hypothetical protein RvY_16264 [Ramazzottius varieornatus]
MIPDFGRHCLPPTLMTRTGSVSNPRFSSKSSLPGQAFHLFCLDHMVSPAVRCPISQVSHSETLCRLVYCVCYTSCLRSQSRDEQLWDLSRKSGPAEVAVLRTSSFERPARLSAGTTTRAAVPLPVSTVVPTNVPIVDTFTPSLNVPSIKTTSKPKTPLLSDRLEHFLKDHPDPSFAHQFGHGLSTGFTIGSTGLEFTLRAINASTTKENTEMAKRFIAKEFIHFV